MRLALTFALSLLTAPAFSQSATGTWLTGQQDSQVVIEPCGANFCGRVAWLKTPNDPETGKPQLDKQNADAGQRGRKVLGINILHSMKDQGGGVMKGSVYNPRDGKTYSATVTPSGNSLTMKGCALAGLICKSETWTRMK